MEAAAAAATASVDEEGVTLELQGGGEELAADPDVARLLSELQAELDADCSDGSDTEEGEDEGEGEGRGEDAKNENENENDDGSHGCLEATGDKPKPEAKDPPSLPRARDQQSAESALVGQVGSQPQTEPPREGGQERGKIDVSRMKIDAPHSCSRQRGGPRPHSAPSACLSAGGFSRLSSRASSSSLFGRTVSQKLLQATKEAEKQRAAALSEAPERGGAGVAVALLPRSSISAAKQNAEALQVRRAAVRFGSC